MNSQRTLRIGVIGLGVGAKHIEGYNKHPSAALAAVCDIDPEKRAWAAATYPGVTVYERDTDLLEDRSIDVVSIASPDDAHFEQVLHGLAAGKHLFVEKPLCLSERELEVIRKRLVDQPQLRMSSNLVLRAAPRFMALKERIDRGEFGTLFHIDADYNYGRLPKILQGWRNRIEGYSVILGGAIHLVDMALWLAGDQVIEVQAMGSSRATAGTSFKSNDLVVATLRFKSGLIAKIGANFACVYPHFHRLSVYGTEATFENGLDHGRLWRSRDPAMEPERQAGTYPGVDKGALVGSFLDEILGRGRSIVSHDDIFHVMAVCLAIDRSVMERRPIHIDPESVEISKQ